MQTIYPQKFEEAYQVDHKTLIAGVLFIGILLLSTQAIAQPRAETATLEKLRVISTETHRFELNTSTDKKLVQIPAQAAGRTIRGEIACDWQSNAVLHNWYPFRYYMYKSTPGLSLIGGGGLNQQATYAYTTTEQDEAGNAGYLFSAHLNHAQVSGQCVLTVTISEQIPLSTAPQLRQIPSSPETPKLQRIPRPPQ
jgi:hypothetical protein